MVDVEILKINNMQILYIVLNANRSLTVES